MAESIKPIGWNRANQVSVKATRRTSWLYLTLSGAVILATIASLYVSKKSTNPEKPDITAESKSIPLVAPAIIVESKDTLTSVATKKKEFWEVSSAETNGFSEAMQRKWIHKHYPPACFTNTSALAYTPPSYAIFNHPSENRIASYLTIANGQTMVGTPVFGSSFEKDFLKSCEEPIIISTDDDEETKALKKMMTDVKIELRQRMANGEKLEDILMETHREVQKLALVRSDIEKVVNEQIREAQSQADLDSIIDAANNMLESKGIAPISLNPILRRNIESRFINVN